MRDEKWARRSLISGLSASVGAFVLGSKASARTKESSFQPARHAQDEWLDKVPGQHRVFIDTASPSGAAEGMQYANNLFTANDSGYGLGDGDLAIVLCLRHQSAVFAFSDAIWSKHGKALAESVEYTDPRTKEAPLANPFTAAPRDALGTLAKRGVQFAVCNLSTRRLSRLLAGAGGDAEAMYKTMVANVIPSGRIVPAGVVAATRSQEYGYSLLFAG
jgi:intracellular sulfur oxidation DsrE/DsrF family protein